MHREGERIRSRPGAPSARRAHPRPRRESRLPFVAVGVDHTTAGIELRERLAFEDAELPSALGLLTDPTRGVLEQAVILSTCNRVELYGVVGPRRTERQLASFLARSHGLDAAQVGHALLTYRGGEVAYHLAATAAGMRSLVLGEAQILGQIRAALNHALAAGTAGPELRRLFESAIAAGRKVRSSTTIGRGVLSVPAAGVELARDRLGTLAQSTAVLIGTGTVAQIVAQQLVKRDVGELLVLGRARSRSEELALVYGGHAITPDRLDDALSRADIIITATSAPLPILRRDRLRRALACRRPDSLPLLLIDLSVPRNIDPSAADLDGVEVHTVDALRSVSERAVTRRRAALPAAEAILDREVARFVTWCERREAGRPGSPLGSNAPGHNQGE